MPQKLLFITSRRRAIWLFWLALLLPVAQVAASAHALSHGLLHASSQLAQEPGADDKNKSAPHAAPCALCAVAATVSAGALVSAPPVLPIPTARYELPRFALASARPVFLVHAYRSRAPPVTQY